MAATRIDGRAIAQEVRTEVAQGVQRLVDAGHRAPGLTAVLVGDDPASEVYVEMKDRAAADAGFVSDTLRLPGSIPQRELLERLDELNSDPSVHGILVQLPLPDHIDESRLLRGVDPRKDVDGFHPVNQGRLLSGRPRFVPATPRGIVELLMRSGHDPHGQDVVIVGRSNIVGKPLAAHLMNKVEGGNATVTVCHSRTRDLAAHTRRADILIVAMGQPEFITDEHVSEGTVVVDVGTHRIDDPTREKGYRLTGDVDADRVEPVARALTPSPGGVGPMTIAMLLRNTLDAAEALEQG